MISIIIPVHNAEKYIADTIKSVLAQTYTDWELLLVDDVSTDGSVEVIRPFLADERISLICLEENVKAAISRNRGIKEAKGDYIAFLDADDLWLPDKLSKQLEFMNEHDAAFSYTAYEFGDEFAKGTGKIVHVVEKMSYRQALSRTIIFTSTVMINMHKLTKEEIFMPNVPSEDTACWWQILRKGRFAYGLEEVLTVYRRPATSLSSNKKVALWRIWNLYRNVEHLNVVYSAWNFIFWAFRATLRRI